MRHKLILTGLLVLACGGDVCEQADCRPRLTLYLEGNRLLPVGKYVVEVGAYEIGIWKCELSIGPLQLPEDTELSCDAAIEASGDPTTLRFVGAAPAWIGFELRTADGDVIVSTITETLNRTPLAEQDQCEDCSLAVAHIRW